MRYLIVTLVLIATFLHEGFALYKESIDNIGLSHSRITLYGSRLKRSEERTLMTENFGDELYRKFIKDKRAYKAGLSLTAIGGIITFYSSIEIIVIGARSAYDYPSNIFNDDFYAYTDKVLRGPVYMLCGGLALLAAGIPTLCIYRSRMKSTISSCNSMTKRNDNIQLSFGPARSGVGLSVVF